MSIYTNFNGKFLDERKNLIHKNRYYLFEKELNDLMNIVYWAKTYNEAMYCYKNKIESQPLCDVCNCAVNFSNYGRYSTYCNNEKCRFNEKLMKKIHTPEAKEKYKQTMLLEYGVDHPSKSPEIRKTMVSTLNKNYGVDVPMKSKEIKGRFASTMNERYGVSYTGQSEELNKKSKETCLQKYGVENFMLTDEFSTKRNESNERLKTNSDYRNEIVSKRERTSINTHGVRHPMQSEEVLDKCHSNGKKYKYFTHKGKEFKYQGYENFAIEFLTNIEINFSNDRNEVGFIEYLKNNKSRMYYPDLKLEDGTYIEVKSEYTLSKSIEKMKLVYECNPDKDIEIWVFDGVSNEPSRIIRSKEELLYV